MNDLNTSDIPTPKDSSLGVELDPESEAVKLFSSFAMLSSMKAAGLCEQITRVVDRQIQQTKSDLEDLS